MFIPAKVTDNRALLKKQPDYLRQLEALPRRLRDAWLEGKWDVFQGQVFQEFTNDPAHYQDRRFTHVIAPFDIPGSGPSTAAMTSAMPSPSPAAGGRWTMTG